MLATVPTIVRAPAPAIACPYSYVERALLMPSGVGVGASPCYQKKSPVRLPPTESKFVEFWMSELGVAAGSAPGQVGQWTGQLLTTGMVAPVSANEPTYVKLVTPSKRPALRFDGSANFLENASFDLSSFQDIDCWAVTVRNALGGGVGQTVMDFDGSNVIYTFVSNTADKAGVFVVGNVGVNGETHDVTSIMDTWRSYRTRCIVSAAGTDEAQGYRDAALIRFSTHSPANNNTDATMGTGPLRFGQRRNSAGGGNFYAGDLAFIGYAESDGDDAATAQYLLEQYGTP